MQIIIFFFSPRGCVSEETTGREKKNIYLVSLPEVGFEPTHPKITELKSAALDHSAIQALEHKEENKEKK